jgi:mannose-6-phosphate isomerase-like protein (cupin superfamily)
MKKINLEQKFSLFTEHWTPKIIAELNDYQIKIVKVQGDFVWHDHSDTDEFFLVLEGYIVH